MSFKLYSFKSSEELLKKLIAEEIVLARLLLKEAASAPLDPSQMTGDASGNTEEETGVEKSEEKDEGEEDPLEKITLLAKDLANATKQVPDVLKAVKAKIQDTQEELKAQNKSPKDVIEALKATQDVILVNVAQRLEQFFNIKVSI